MTKRKHKLACAQSARVPYSVIRRAMKGDEDALEQILHHYRPRISLLVRTAVWKGSSTTTFVDDGIRQEIENDFLLTILKFRDLTD